MSASFSAIAFSPDSLVKPPPARMLPLTSSSRCTCVASFGIALEDIAWRRLKGEKRVGDIGATRGGRRLPMQLEMLVGKLLTYVKCCPEPQRSATTGTN